MMDIYKIIKEEVAGFMKEDYPASFSMEEFKKLTSFAKRIAYCEEHLQRISSGSSRIVYKIDDEKVLKLAKNKKGIAQNEVEIEYGQYSDLEDVLATVFDNDSRDLWVEMELARKINFAKFEQITGFKFKDFAKGVHNSWIDSNGTSKDTKNEMDIDLMQEMWDDGFVSGVFNLISTYGVPFGDLIKISTYGIVKRDGEDEVAIIDYGLTSDVYDSYYS